MIKTITDGVSLFKHAIAHSNGKPAVLYFDQEVSYELLNSQSDALAIKLIERGFLKGDRLAVYMQNIPQFVVAVVACWKIGGIFVPINPMNRADELSHIYADAQLKAIIMEPDLYLLGHSKVPNGNPIPKIVITASPIDKLTKLDNRVFPDPPRTKIEGILSLEEIVVTHKGKSPPKITVDGTDIAAIVYTSGTTGKPKGAMISHKGIAVGALLAQKSTYFPQNETMLAIAPLFHITGLIVNLMSVFSAAGTIILSYRFNPDMVVQQIFEKKPFTTIGAITAFIAIMNVKGVNAKKLASLKIVAAGGAPLPPEVHNRVLKKFGLNILNGYGMTETSSIVVMVDKDKEQRIDPQSGALSVGTPLPGCNVFIVGDDDKQVEIGEIGEIVISTPAITLGYWGNETATKDCHHKLGWRSGDVGKLDVDGWLYIVDRKKDMIISSGFKIWPREVEDALYTHPAVREAAVVGVPDSYRGEQVKAYISLNSGHKLQPKELRGFMKQKLSAYKVPRQIEILAELPKTPTGKILRRAFRSSEVKPKS